MEDLWVLMDTIRVTLKLTLSVTKYTRAICQMTGSQKPACARIHVTLPLSGTGYVPVRAQEHAGSSSARKSEPTICKGVLLAKVQNGGLECLQLALEAGRVLLPCSEGSICCCCDPRVDFVADILKLPVAMHGQSTHT